MLLPIDMLVFIPSHSPCFTVCNIQSYLTVLQNKYKAKINPFKQNLLIGVTLGMNKSC